MVSLTKIHVIFPVKFQKIKQSISKKSKTLTDSWRSCPNACTSNMLAHVPMNETLSSSLQIVDIYRIVN